MDTESSLTLTVDSSASEENDELTQKLKDIERLTQENLLLEEKLESLRARLAVESHPIVQKYCDARINNLEILELQLSNAEFKKKERVKIIQLLILGAEEIWYLGDQRAARFIEAYVQKPEPKVGPAQEEFNFRFPEEPESSPKPTASDEVKTLYRELVKVLHPDKETDETKKEEKNVLMKQVTAAFENRDVHTLLLLVSKYVKNKEAVQSKLSSYVKELNETLQKLKQEKQNLTKSGPLASIYKNLFSRQPQKIEQKLREQLEALEAQVRAEQDVADIYLDDLYLRTFLREISF